MVRHRFDIFVLSLRQATEMDAANQSFGVTPRGKMKIWFFDNDVSFTPRNKVISFAY